MMARGEAEGALLLLLEREEGESLTRTDERCSTGTSYECSS